ncbi:cation:proton antiporter [Tundrisphaera sp. TA3]|uniref:cation:proton antiporter n=1 Tax=Tundrisphaera sp. TA3 TaxID=3435775 RepID=UPI003EBE59A3
MAFNAWFVVIGSLLILMALAGSTLKRLPLSSAMLYLAAGLALGPRGFGLIDLDPIGHSGFVERFTEVAVLVSLFSAGLKLRTPLDDERWRLPFRLASASMMLTVAMIALVGHAWLGLPAGAAVLLGAILAPTDPVLASDVQVTSTSDRDRVRFSLTGEAGLNDGTAFPFVVLGLGLMGHHPLGDWGWRWLAVDVAWAVVAGLGIGAVLGSLIGRLVLHLRRTHKEAVGLDDFLALGLVSLTYGLALLAHSYGFLAVFAAGIALRRVERSQGGEQAPHDVIAGALAGEETATHPEKAPAYMAETVLGFSEQLERILEVAVVLLLGGMLLRASWPREAIWFVPLLFLILRPAAVLLGLVGSSAMPFQRFHMAWFGIRGIGSLYYLAYAIQHGVPHELAARLTSLVFATVAASIVVHGISVTPLMGRYGRIMDERRRRKASA